MDMRVGRNERAQALAHIGPFSSHCRIMRSDTVEHPAKRRRALLGSNPPGNSRCKRASA